MKSNKKIDIIEECQSLEQELSKYKLWGSLIPKGSFYANLREVLTKSQWDSLRNLVYEKNSYRCFICGITGVTLEAHEHWKYDYKNSIQKLHDVNALCRLCHLNNHLGLAAKLVRKGKLDQRKLAEHWCKINQEEITSFRYYQKRVKRLWELRNQFEWKIVDKNNKEIFKDLDYNKLMESLKLVLK